MKIIDLSTSEKSLYDEVTVRRYKDGYVTIQSNTPTQSNEITLSHDQIKRVYQETNQPLNSGTFEYITVALTEMFEDDGTFFGLSTKEKLARDQLIAVCDRISREHG